MSRSASWCLGVCAAEPFGGAGGRGAAWSPDAHDRETMNASPPATAGKRLRSGMEVPGRLPMVPSLVRLSGDAVQDRHTDDGSTGRAIQELVNALLSAFSTRDALAHVFACMCGACARSPRHFNAL